MTLPYFFGLAAIAWSLPLSIFLIVIAPHPQLIVVFLSSCFLSLVAFTITSVLYAALQFSQETTLLTTFFYTVIIELVRLWYIKLFERAEKNFRVIGTNAVAFPLVHFYSAIASGVGFGFTHVMLTYGQFILESTHEGVIFPSGDCSSAHSSFLNAAIISLFYQVVHIVASLFGFQFYILSTVKEIIITLVVILCIHILFAFVPLLGVGFGFCHSASVIGGSIACLLAIAAIVLVTRKSYRSRKHVD